MKARIISPFFHQGKWYFRGKGLVEGKVAEAAVKEKCAVKVDDTKNSGAAPENKAT